MNKKKDKKVDFLFERIYFMLQNTSNLFDSSKLFAGFMLLLLHISSKYVPFQLSPSVESFFKNSFGTELLIFVVLWVGTKQFFISLFLTFLFILLFRFLLNENSRFSLLPESFTQYYTDLETKKTNKNSITEEEVKHAKKILKQYNEQYYLI